MANVKVCDCGKSLAVNAKTCPGCGKRFAGGFKKFLKIIVWVNLTALILGAVIAMIMAGR